MNAVDFKYKNHDWQKPQSMTDEECGPLPAFVDDEQSISCWKGTWKDRIRFLFKGNMWLHVWMSGQQPPVCLATQTKWNDGETGKEVTL